MKKKEGKRQERKNKNNYCYSKKKGEGEKKNTKYTASRYVQKENKL